jgi:hypothetical protein
MHTILTAKRRLHTTPDQFRTVRQTQLAYRAALNSVRRSAFAHGNAHGKTSNKVTWQDGTYHDIRSRFGLPAQMTCSVPRQVGATEQALWTKGRAHAAARAAGRTKKRSRGLRSALAH